MGLLDKAKDLASRHGGKGGGRADDDAQPEPDPALAEPSAGIRDLAEHERPGADDEGRLEGLDPGADGPGGEPRDGPGGERRG